MTYSLLIIAGLGAFALIISRLFSKFVPEIVVFLALGVLIGPEGPLGLINRGNIRSLELLTQVALGAIIFLIGDRLRIDALRGSRRLLVPLNLAQMAGAVVLVFLATRWAGADTRVALILALIAAETGVLTVTATIKEQKAAGRLSDLILSSVGVTNAATAALFGLAFPFILASTGEVDSVLGFARVFVQIVVASAVIGLGGGWLFVRFTRGFETSGELLLFLLITVTAMVGGALAVEGSVVVTTLIAGLYVANAAPWLADRLFAGVRTLEAPIYLVFFVVAGASIHLDELATVGVVGAAYLVARTLGKLVGGALGGLIGVGPRGVRLGATVGLSLLPHAGMAIALVAFVVESSPRLGPEVSAVVLGSIVLFELLGPLSTRWVLRAAGEAGKAKAKGSINPLAALEITSTFDKVLVPVGSAEIVLPRLAFLLDLVANMGAELVAVHVSRPGSGADEQQEPEVLALIRRIAGDRNLTCTTVHRVSEQIARTIAQVAQEEEVDLIVMGEPTRGSVLEPARWGLVSQRVLRAVDIPVLVYPVDPHAPDSVPSVYVRQALQAQVADAQAGTLPAREGA